MNPRQRRTDRVWLLALMLATGTAWAQAPATPSTATSPASGARAAGDKVEVVQLSRADAAFLMQAAQNGLAEVQASRLALTRATLPAVKQFAQQMVDDHTKAHEELAALAKSKGMTLPGEPSMVQRGKLKMLDTREGAAFDDQYAESMAVEAHQETVTLFQQAAREADDAQIKAWAAKTLPTLQRHLAMANGLRSATRAAAGRPNETRANTAAPAASGVGTTETATPRGAATGTPRP